MAGFLHFAGNGMKGAGRPHVSFSVRFTVNIFILSLFLFSGFFPVSASAQTSGLRVFSPQMTETATVASVSAQAGGLRVFSPQMTDRDRNRGGSKNRTITSSCVKLSKTSYSYDGHSKKPSVTVRCGGRKLTKGKDYTVTYKNNKKVGTAKAIVRGKGKYRGSVTKTFKIKKAGKR